MKVTDSESYPHLLILPENYDESREYPLTLFLHGSGERGDDLDRVTNHGPFVKLRELGIETILVAPQCPRGEFWDPARLARLLDEVAAARRIDASRVYVTGLSRGGYGAWLLAGYQPERFAAIAPICGGGSRQDAPQLAHLPVWAFHGDADTVVPLEASQKMVKALEAVGGSPKFTIYPGAGHEESWVKAYDDPAFYEWLYSQQRP